MSTPAADDRHSRRYPVLALIGLSLIIVAILPGARLVAYQRQIAAMRAATACTGDSQRECLLSVESTIAGLRSGAGKSMIIRLNTPEAVAGAYEFADGSDVLTDAQVGDVVTANVWRGKTVALIHDGGRSYTRDAPYRAANDMVLLTGLPGLIGLAFLVKYAFGTTVLNDDLQWRINFGSWQSVTYNAILLLAASFALTPLVFGFHDADPGLRLNGIAFGFAVAALGVGLNSIRLMRREREADAAARRTFVPGRPVAGGSRRTWWVAAVPVLIGLSAAVGSVDAAFMHAAEATTARATNRAAAHAAPCPPSMTLNCLVTESPEVSPGVPAAAAPVAAAFAVACLALGAWVIRRERREAKPVPG